MLVTAPPSPTCSGPRGPGPPGGVPGQRSIVSLDPGNCPFPGEAASAAVPKIKSRRWRGGKQISDLAGQAARFSVHAKHSRTNQGFIDILRPRQTCLAFKRPKNPARC